MKVLRVTLADGSVREFSDNEWVKCGSNSPGSDYLYVYPKSDGSRAIGEPLIIVPPGMCLCAEWVDRPDEAEPEEPAVEGTCSICQEDYVQCRHEEGKWYKTGDASQAVCRVT